MQLRHVAIVIAVATATVGCEKSGEQPKVAQTAPAQITSGLEGFSFKNREGVAVTVADYAGKVVLVDFWATWCAPCKTSLPIYEIWQQQLGPKGFVILAVSMDEETDGVYEFAEKLAPSLMVLRDEGGAAAEALDLPTMPTAYLINKDGSLVERHVGFKEEEAPAFYAKIEKLLN